MLRLSIDEREDEDREGIGAELPFVIAEDLADQYGERFNVMIDAHGMPVVEVAS